jgi:hypothetical protein
MNTAIWIVQGLLALVFVGAGISKLIQPYEKLAERMGYVKDFSPGAIRAIGAWEVLGALGLVLPALTGILPWLSPLAAGGLAVDIGGAMATHLRRGEYPMLIGNLILLLLAAFVVYGRLVAVSL